MLSKSLKHEFRATSRVMLPVFIALLLLAIAAHFSTLLLNGSNLPWFLQGIGGTMIALFVISLVAAGVGVIVLTVVRFYRSFLSDEGYLTMTLPVGMHTHISSRLIVSAVWYTLTGLAIGLCVLVMLLDASGWKGVLTGVADFFRQIAESRMTGHAILVLLELLLSAVVGSAFTSLLLYAALSVGHSFNRHKKLLSVVFAFVFYHVVQLICFFVIYGLSRFNWDSLSAKFDLEPLKVIPFMEGMLGLGIAATIALGAVFYFITHYFLSKRLNLE